MKEVICKKIMSGVLYGCAMFVFALLVVDNVLDSSLSVLPHQYTRIIFGALFLGVGFILSSLIYERDDFPFAVRTLIHLLICVFAVFCALLISGGIPDGAGFGTGVYFLIIETIIGFFFWIGNCIFFFREARKIKKRLEEYTAKSSEES